MTDTDLPDAQTADVEPIHPVEDVQPVRVKRPVGAPPLSAYPALNRRQKADLWQLLQPVIDSQRVLNDGDTPEGAAMAALTKLIADSEDCLRYLADEETFDVWSAQASDKDITDLLTWYVNIHRVGEDVASTTS